MKTVYKTLVLSTCACFLSFQGIGQGMPTNSDFEFWTSINFNDPVHWINANTYNLSIPDTSVSKITGVSGSGIKIKSHFTGTPWFITNSAGNILAAEGGEPYTSQPTGVSVQAKYNITTGDTARMLFLFKKNGAVILEDTFSFWGSANNFTTHNFSFSQSFTTAPDSVIVFIASGDIYGVPPFGTSTLEMDNLLFTGATQQLANGNFDNWKVVVKEEPTDWFIMDSTSKTTDRYSGNYAARLVTYDAGGGSYHSSAIMQTFAPNSNTFAVTGYYKYIPQGKDTACVRLGMTGGYIHLPGLKVWSVEDHPLPPTDSWKRFSIPLKSDSLISVDDVTIQFHTSYPDSIATPGSTLLLDSLGIKDTYSPPPPPPTTVSEASRNVNELRIFPNPANTTVYISVTGSDESCSVRIINFSGKEVATATGSSKEAEVSVAHLPPGLYLCEVLIDGRKQSRIFSKI